jgi:hypothetical protein
MCKSPAAVGTYCTPEQTTVMRGPQRPMGSSANIYQRDIVLQFEVGMLLFQHFQDLRSECRIISQKVLKVRPVKKHGLTFLLLHHACVLTFGTCLLLNNGVCLGRQRKRTRTQRQSPQREEGAGVAKDRSCVQRLLLEQCLALNDHRGPRKHGKYQRSKDSNICLSIQGPNVSQIKSSLCQIDATGS